MIKLRPLMEVPRVVHRKGSPERPCTGSTESSRLPSPKSPPTRGPYIGVEIHEKSGCNPMSPRKPWVVTCPRDCRCREHKPKRKVLEVLPKWWLNWQAKHLTGDSLQELMHPSDEDETAAVFGTGSGSLGTRSWKDPSARRVMTAPHSGGITLDEERDGECADIFASTTGSSARFKHHKSNVRPPKVFAPRAKTTGGRELSINDVPEDAVNTWARGTSDSAALSSTAPEVMTESSARPNKRLSERRQSLGFGMIISLSKKHGIPPQEVRQCAEEFRAMDTNRDGRLSMQEFEVAVRKRCDLPVAEQLPPSLAATMSRALEGRLDGSISFEDFLLWVWQCIFMEEMSATDSEERQQRNLARELGLDLPKLESLKETFNSCDDDRSGFIEWPEFDQLVRCLLDAKEATDVSEALLRRYWKEANTSAEKIDFPDFVRWYAKNFA